VGTSWLKWSFRREVTAWAAAKDDVEGLVICDDTGMFAVLEE
jgi:hypothetical protein